MRIYLVDAFASGPFTGNPAAVCPLEFEPSAEWMQKVAMEMNQAETAFFWPVEDGYGLRWFTPTVEVDLCGHATLASAHVLFSAPVLARTPGRPDARTDTLHFHTRSGVLTCHRARSAGLQAGNAELRATRALQSEIEMDFPSEAPSEVEAFSVVDALGVQPVWMGANRMDWFFELASAEELLALRPDMAEVRALGKRGVIVTAGAGAGVGASGSASAPSPHFLSRFFAPQSGIDEDPVTGSAHCALGPYWAAKLGRTTVVGYQASKRGGTVRVDVHGDRVVLTGQAVTTLVGELRV